MAAFSGGLIEDALRRGKPLGDNMRSIVFAAAVSALLLGVARADEGHLSGLPAALLGGAAAEGTQHELPKAPVTSISAGGLTAVLGKTTLGDVASALGGTVATASDGGQDASWLCYTATIGGQAAYIWFLANSTDANGALDLVGGNFSSVGKSQPCVAPKVSLDDINFSVPGLGASQSALQQQFGTVAARYGFVAYSSEHGSNLQNLNYLIKDDVIVGLAVTRITAP